MKELSIPYLLDIGIALSSEKDRDALLERILTAAMDVTDCDAGTLYIKKENALSFHLMLTRSHHTMKGGRHGKISLPPVPISRENACAYALLERTLINVPDVSKSDCFDFTGPKRYDSMTGYQTTSMMVVPMEDDSGLVIGVLQLINALDQNRKPIPFPPECEQVILALASQAAICLTNMNYAASVQALLNSLVSVLSTAIEARSPYNTNHTRNMALYAERFIDWINQKKLPWCFTETEKRIFLMSVWLHDVGKLTTPLVVMNKESRLSGSLERVLTRLETIGLLSRIQALEGKESPASLAQELRDARLLIETVNGIDLLPDNLLAEIQKLSRKTYVDQNGEVKPWLNQDEVTALSVRKGTLTESERSIMEDHVLMTSRILAKVQFVGEYSRVPLWAGQHHEFLNGSGYPHHLTAKDIPKETRLLTILDIFDALTARDRPYKPSMPFEKAFEVLQGMVNAGQLDGEILALFLESRAWEEPV